MTEKAKTADILAAAGAPSLDTLPDAWRETVQTLEQTIMAQAIALQVAERVIGNALDQADAGESDSAIRLLRNGHGEIARMLSGDAKDRH